MPEPTPQRSSRNTSTTGTSTSERFSYDAWVSKALRPALVLSLLMRLLLSVTTSYQSAGGWVESISIANYRDDVPTVISWGNNDATNTTTTTTTGGSNTTKIEALLSNETNIHTVVANNSTGSSSTVVERLQGTNDHDIQAPTQVHRIPLVDLINSSQPNITCNPGKSGKRFIQSTPFPPEYYFNSSRKIPKIIHVTSKTRCMTPPFLNNLDKWRFPGYGFYFHDDAAVDRLLAKYWPEFPHLQWLQHCMISGAAKADLWRLLILWEYGGIYTDIDNAPGPMFQKGDVIQEDDEAWFVVENMGIMSQYFMAAEPRHPLMYISILVLLERLLEVPNIRKQYVPVVTGPGTLKWSMMQFRNTKDEQVKAGKYTGIANKTVTVAGRKGHGKEYVIRTAVSGIHKMGGYFAMGMKHFSSNDDQKPTDSCYEYLHKIAKEDFTKYSLRTADRQGV